MPVYVCNPGKGAEEPWRRNFQVFAAPFEWPTESSGSTTTSHQNQNSSSSLSLPRQRVTDLVSAAEPVATDASKLLTRADDEDIPTEVKNSHYHHHQQQQYDEHREAPLTANGSDSRPETASHRITLPNPSAVLAFPMPIRRVRHSEILIVDDVCIQYSRYWLRLRWPGRKGGFAGYIAMGRVDAVKMMDNGNRDHRLTTAALTGPGSAEDDRASQIGKWIPACNE